MAQDKIPQFSHITVGTADNDQSIMPEEEVIPIGAVDASLEHQGEDAVSGEQAAVESPVISGKHDMKTDQVENQAALDEKRYLDEELGGPMGLMQKIVIIVCAIALVVGIVLIAWFWLFKK